MSHITQTLTCIVALFIVAITATSTPAAADGIADHFQHGEPGTMPPDWFVPPVLEQRGVRAQLTNDNPFIGEKCLQLHGPDGAGFTNVMRVIDAEPFRGQRIAFTAAVRVEPHAAAQLWLRVDLAEDRRGFFDNMHDRPIRDAEWREYTIIGDIADDAVAINIGLMLPQGGTAWIDNVSLVPVGRTGEHDEAARELTERGLTNLTALTRLLGYVRYFHPSDEAAEMDWDAWTISAVRHVEQAPSDAHLATALRDVVQPIAPAIRINHGKIPPIDRHHLNPHSAEPDQLVRWKHFGVSSHVTEHTMPGIYNSRRAYDAINRIDDDERPLIIERELAPRIKCHVPIDVYVKDGRTLPRAEGEFDPRATWPDGFSPTARDRATRLAGVMLAWTVLQHFYPYFDVVETDWDAALTEALLSAATNEGEAAHLSTLRTLITHLHDGHGMVSHQSAFPATALPLIWDWVDDQLVVTAVNDTVADLAPGDIVLAIDSRDTNDCYTETASLISGATEQWIRYRAAHELRMSFPTNDPATLTIRTADGEPRDISVPRIPISNMLHDDLTRPENGSELVPGIIFINLNGLDRLDQVLPTLTEAKGIVFDLRGYPGGAGAALMHHLTDQLITSPQWHIPETELPDRENITFRHMPGWRINPRPPRLTAPAAFLADGRAISYAESILGIVEHYNLGDIVGSPTAGTNGNVNPLSIPGGYFINWTGMRVLKHDGSQHHAVGIHPTIPATRTITGISNGRDEVLDTAVKALQAKIDD